jgi:hypothetical protein
VEYTGTDTPRLELWLRFERSGARNILRKSGISTQMVNFIRIQQGVQLKSRLQHSGT